MDLRALIATQAEQSFAPESGSNRRPRVGFARADLPFFAELQYLAGPKHLLPRDLLAQAKTVVALAFPIPEAIVRGNLGGAVTTREWTLVKNELDDRIHTTIRRTIQALAAAGVASAESPALEPHDRAFNHRWSQKHVAYAAGLGTFGLNHLLITDCGSAVRLGSFVMDAEVPCDPMAAEEYCLAKHDGACSACILSCPSQALTRAGLNKAVCSAWLDRVAEQQGSKSLRACGKCVATPCALRRPRHAVKRTQPPSSR